MQMIQPVPAPSRPAPDDLPAVRVRGLVKRYGGRAVVDGVDLDVRRGEVFALLGPNGAGKTTTVEVLAGVRRRDAGEVRVLGVDPVSGDRAWRDRVGVVAQTTGAGNALTVRETVDHFAHYHATPVPSTELLDLVGLRDTARTRVEKLSGGQRRRLEVALGVQGRPELLFLDEPTTGLDPAARRQFWALVRSLRHAGTTVLLTTHYLDEAAQLADRVGVITAGRLVEVAPPAELGGHLRAGATVRWTEDGVPREVHTATPAALLRDLLAAVPHGEVPDLTVTRPDLEDVYLRMVAAAEEDPR
ncbi:ABC transporter ATP-binding protein [Geodermatophilus sp. DSM 45219]|uniref:ABC transporter ATP-binding protein n=1 Tax=Geodermatophilus sp. DSM 45219 TaxID=1881103 RepID=UPI00088C4D7D|nr:ABC transporter ATP-binding protein [Geodermatophilus sp. DSM 45219]SDN42357.1 ABC-2 type transport system ATP-binding protein [Geodermatophilus sp. DSM 45219]